MQVRLHGSRGGGPRASTLMSYCATVRSLALPHAHIRHASSCYKCTPVHSLALPHSCHATLLYVHTHTHTCTRHATSALLYILSRFHTHVMLCYCTLSGASAHMSCYATVRFVCASTLMACYFTVRSLPSTLMSCYAMYTLSCTCA